MIKLRSFAIWVYEMLAEAVGTALWMLALTRLRTGPDPGHSIFEVLGAIPVAALLILLFFGITGYVVTTLLSALYLPRRRWYLYPLVSCLLYVIHSTPLLYQKPVDAHNLPLQLCGAATAFLVTYLGDRLRISNWATNATPWKGIRLFQQ